jgi:hypothetical protein
VDLPDLVHAAAERLRARPPSGDGSGAEATGGVHRGLHLLALWSFAIAQPLLDVLARAPDFFVARRLGPAAILGLLLAAVVGPPLLLWGGLALVGAASRRAAGALHGLTVALLAAAVALPLLGRGAWLPPGVVLGLAALAGGLFAGAYRRFAPLRSALSLLALAPIVFAAVFLSEPRIASLVGLRRGTEAPPTPVVASETPVVLVVFDELPLNSLLDAGGAIDPVRYPNFARLARHATWLRGATTVHAMTVEAIPAILTGRYPALERVPATAAAHPHNLFALLSGSYALNVHETGTALHPIPGRSGQALAGAARSASDLARVALHVLIPDPWRARLTPVDEAWGDLVVEGGDGASERIRWVDHPALFRNFVRSIDGEPGPVLHFLHSSLPHRPWQYLPSGHAFFPFDNHGRGPWFEMSEDAWFRIDEQHRHLLQVAFVDNLLGELLDRLEAIGLYDRALLIVTADHGASFWPGDDARIPGRSRHPFDILSVPLLIKRPHQRAPEIDDANVETIDILPTILDVLDVDLAGDARAAWRLDGCSVFDPACPRRPTKRVYEPVQEGAHRNRRLEFAPEPAVASEGLARKLRLFGSGAAGLGTARYGAYAMLVGRPAPPRVRASGEPPGSVTLDRSPRPPRLSPHALVVPVRVSGVLELAPDRLADDTPPRVAVASDGIIRAVVPAPRDATGAARVLATLDEATVAGEGAPDLAFYLVEGDPERARLRPLALR